MTRQKKLFLTTILTALLLLVPISVMADYNSHTVFGDDNQLSRDILGQTPSTGWNTITPSISTTGSITEPLIFDWNGDGTTETMIFDDTNGILNVFSQNLQTSPSTSFEIGQPQINPVACDLDSDGKKEYSVITKHDNVTTLYVLDYSTSGTISVLSQKNVTQTNETGNMICYKFYEKEGDQTTYLFWLDQTKLLHQVKITASEIVETTHNSANFLDGKTSVDYETEGRKYIEGNYELVQDTDFDAQGHNSLLWIAGNETIQFSSGGLFDTIFFPITAYFTNTENARALHLLGGIETGGGKTGLLVYTSGLSALPFATYNKWAIIKETNSIFTGRSMFVSTYSNAFGSSVGCGGPRISLSMTAFDKDSDGIDDIFGVLTSDGSGFPCPAQGATELLSWNAQNGTVTNHISGTTIPYGSSINLGIDSRGRILSNRKNIYFNSAGRIIRVSPSSNYTIPINVFNTSGFLYMPVMASIDAGGIMDFVYTDPTSTRFHMSGEFVLPPTTILLPFSVKLNNTDGLRSVTKIIAGFQSVAYNYALACDIGFHSLWNENFGVAGYNFTTSNVSTNIVNPETYLTLGGFRVSIGGNSSYSSLDIQKNGLQGYRDDMDLDINFVPTAPFAMDVIAFDDSDLVTEYYRFNVTAGNNLTISKILGANTTDLSTSIQSQTNWEIKIKHKPKFDFITAKNYFEDTIEVNGENLTTTTTQGRSGSNIKKLRVFLDSPGTYTFSSISLGIDHNTQPDLIEFDNNLVTIVDGEPFFVSAPFQEINGNGFQILMGTNDTFYGECIYQNNGTYTQRHYLSLLDSTTDYSNFKDIVVTVSQTQNFIGEGIFTTGDAFGDALNGLFGGLGILSATSRFFFWFVLSLIIAIIISSKGPLFGVFTFMALLVLGSFIGFVPVWVTILLIILGGGVVAVSLRMVFGGG